VDVPDLKPALGCSLVGGSAPGGMPRGPCVGESVQELSALEQENAHCRDGHLGGRILSGLPSVTDSALARFIEVREMMKSMRTFLLVAISMLAVGPAHADQVVEIDVQGLSCEFCAYGLENQLVEMDGVLQAQVSLGLKRARITFDDGATIDEDALRQAVLDSGFTPAEIRHVDIDQ
jgi:copper chaperone CopZ